LGKKVKYTEDGLPYEWVIQEMLVKYMELQYPNIICKFDSLANVYLTPHQRQYYKKQGMTKSFPDLLIAEPREKYHAFFLELKRDGFQIFRKNGNFVSERIEQQYKMLTKLRTKGYYAEFAFGFDDARQKIDSYLKI
jgi:hypothetical protein